MRASDFILESNSPFPNSQLQDVVYHGGPPGKVKFARRAHGTYISQYEDYATQYGNVIPLYVDVRNIADLGSDAEELDWVFERKYKQVAKWLAQLNSQGYDAVRMYGDGDSLILIGDVPVVHAKSGKEM